MPDMYGANLPTPSPSVYGGSPLEAPRQDISNQLLVGGIGSLAIDAYKGKLKADAEFDLASLEKQTQAANETLLGGGTQDAALSKFTEKIKNLDAGIFSGSLTPAEYKIKREMLLKEHTKNMPGLAADFQQIYASTGERKTEEQFALRKQMDVLAEKERERVDAQQKMIDQFYKDQGVNMERYFHGTPEQRAAERNYGDRMQILKMQAQEAASFANLNKDVRTQLGVSKVNQMVESIIPTLQLEATKQSLSLLQQFNPNGIVTDGDPNVAVVNFAAETGKNMIPAQKDILKKQLMALRDSTKNQLSTRLIGMEIGSTDRQAIVDSINRYDMIINTLDNADLAKMATAQVQAEKSMDILNLRKLNPGLANSLTLLEEFGKQIPPIYANEITSDLRDYLKTNKQRAGLSTLNPLDNTNPYNTIATEIDPKGDAGVAANNLSVLNNMVAIGARTPQAAKDLAKAAQSYMQLPNDPNMLNMKTIEAYLILLNNPKLGDLMKEHPTFTDKVMGNVGYILENKMKPFIKDQVSSLITENTRLVKGADSIIFEGENAAKLNKFAGLLNNTVSSVSKITGEKTDGYRNRQKLMKQDVQSIIDELRQPAKVEEKTSTWFSNFLGSINPTAEVPLGDVLGAATKGGVAAAKAVAKGVDVLTSPDVIDFVDAATAATLYALKPENVAKELLVRSKEFATWWHDASTEQRDSFVERSKKQNQGAK